MKFSISHRIGQLERQAEIIEREEVQIRLTYSEVSQEDDDQQNHERSVSPPVYSPTIIQQKKMRKKNDLKYDWKDPTVEKLIVAWENETLLYNVNHQDYHKKERRRSAITRIIEELRCYNIDPLPSFDDVMKKINALRTYYVAERNKAENSKASGAGTNDVYHSKWQFYEHLSFLKDNITPRATYSTTQKRVNQNNDADNSFAFTPQNGPSTKSARRMDINRTKELISTAIDVLNKPKEAQTINQPKVKSTDSLFAEMIGNMLEEIPNGQGKDMLKIEIQRMLYATKYNSHQTQQIQSCHSGVSRQYMSNLSHRASTPMFDSSQTSQALSSPDSVYSYRSAP